MPHVLAVLCALAALLIASEARAEKRVALIIGNSAYENTAELKNPRSDAADIAGVLAKFGFDVVEGRDLDKRSMERIIRQFGVKLAGADVALFFYAGHGVQVGGQNHLVPTDARLAGEGDIDFETLPLSLVLRQMEREAKTSLVLLDACRDNPLAKNLARNMGTRSTQIGQGLAEVRTGVGTLIGFSTQPGAVALDGDGRNSPYAAALLKHLETPGKDVSAVLVAVRNDVLKATGGTQVPWEHTSLTGQVFLNPLATPAPQASADAPPRPAVPTAPAYDKDMELAFWNAVKDSKSSAVVQTYLDRFPAGTFSGLARVMVDQARKDEALKKSATASKSPDAAAKFAGLPPPQVEPPRPALVDPAALARALQAEMKRVGCDPGAVDGRWGRKASDALGQFSRLTKISVPTDQPTEAALQAVAGQKGRICPLSCDDDEHVVDGRCVAKSRSQRASKSIERERPAPTRRRAEPSESGGGSSKKMCWSQDGRSFAMVPCSN